MGKDQAGLLPYKRFEFSNVRVSPAAVQTYRKNSIHLGFSVSFHGTFRGKENQR